MITHDYKLIFIHLPKTGGRTVCDAFNQRFDHYTADYYRKEFYPYFHGYTMFTIVRNPFDRLVSMYHYIKEHRRHVHEDVFTLGKGINYQPSFEEWIRTNMRYYTPFNITSPEGERGTDGELGSPHYFSSMYRRLGGKLGDVVVLRYEDGFDKIGEQVSVLAKGKVTFGHENKSTHHDYKQYYDEKLIKDLMAFAPFRQDLDVFGYSFDGVIR